jgi:hypothetical protein
VKPIRFQRKKALDDTVIIVFHAANYILITIYIVNDSVGDRPRLSYFFER